MSSYFFLFILAAITVSPLTGMETVNKDEYAAFMKWRKDQSEIDTKEIKLIALENELLKREKQCKDQECQLKAREEKISEKEALLANPNFTHFSLWGMKPISYETGPWTENEWLNWKRNKNEQETYSNDYFREKADRDAEMAAGWVENACCIDFRLSLLAQSAFKHYFGYEIERLVDKLKFSFLADPLPEWLIGNESEFAAHVIDEVAFFMLKPVYFVSQKDKRWRQLPYNLEKNKYTQEVLDFLIPRVISYREQLEKGFREASGSDIFNLIMRQLSSDINNLPMY